MTQAEDKLGQVIKLANVGQLALKYNLRTGSALQTMKGNPRGQLKQRRCLDLSAQTPREVALLKRNMLLEEKAVTSMKNSHNLERSRSSQSIIGYPLPLISMTHWSSDHRPALGMLHSSETESKILPLGFLEASALKALLLPGIMLDT